MNTSYTTESARSYHDAISERARQIWRERGEPTDSDVEIWLQAERELVERGAIPPAPPERPGHRMSGRVAADEIDEDELEDRLGGFGTSGVRSPTSVDPTTP